MDADESLRQLTRRIVSARDGRSPDQLLRVARELRNILNSADAAPVERWLDTLRNQPASVSALCSAEAALLAVRDESSSCARKLLDAWVDSAALEFCTAAIKSAAAYQADKQAAHHWKPIVRIYAAPDPVPSGSAVQVRLRVAVPGAGDSMLWDERELREAQPVALAIALSGLGSAIEFYSSAKPSDGPPGPLDRYHPERFMTDHRGVRRLSPLANAMAAVGRVAITLPEFERIQSVVMSEVNAKLFELPMEIRQRSPRLGSAPYAQVLSLAGHVVAWMAAGRQIYDLPPGIVSRFRQTDVDDVPLTMLRLPYEAMYLYWGPQSDLELEPGWLIDGAYVSGGEDGIQLVVTSVPVDLSQRRWWPVNGEPYYYQALTADVLRVDVGTAVDMVLAKELAELRQRASKQGVDVDGLLAAMVADGEFEPSQLPTQIVDVSARTAGQEIERLTRRHAVYVASLKLVINGLCYLTAYPDDTAAEYPADAPEALVRAAKSSDYKTAKSARGRLAELGYLPVHICGRELARAGDRPSMDDRHVRAHWRRGHWRRQAYGEGRTLRKLVWLMPTLVGAGNEEPLGHIYLVS